MAKRPVMSVDELVSEPELHTETVGQGTPDEEEFDLLYCRIPRSLYRKLRKRSFELSENRRKRVSQTDLVVQALRQYLE